MKKYFDSIPHSKLSLLLTCKFKDKALLHLFNKLIASYSVTEGWGLPIGNLTSQYFANFYLSFGVFSKTARYLSFTKKEKTIKEKNKRLCS